MPEPGGATALAGPGAPEEVVRRNVTEPGRSRLGARLFEVARHPTAVFRSYLFWPAAAYVIARVATFGAVAIADVWTSHGIGNTLNRWDGTWFLRAADTGWPRHLPMAGGHVLANPIAFFPVYPGLIRLIDHLVPLSPLTVELLLTAVTGLSATLAISLLARRIWGREVGRRAGVLIAVFPGSFIFSLGYSEGVAMTCTALGLLALIERRWWVAGLLGLVATATTPVALAFAASCLVAAGAAVRSRREWRSLVAPALAPLGMAAYMVWIWRHTGNLMAWRLTERDGWHSGPSIVYPFKVMWRFLSDPIAPTLTGQILVVGTVVTAIGALRAVRQRQPLPVLTYGLVAALIAACSAPVGLRPRFILLAFPIVVALTVGVSRRVYTFLAVASALALVAMTALELTSWAVFP
jgi:hypothetical protein